MATREAPCRAFVLTIKLGGDTWEQLTRELQRFTDHVIDHGENCDLVSGGPDSGGWLQIERHPDMTHEKYVTALEEYLQAQRTAADPSLQTRT